MPTITKLYTMEEASQHNTTADCWIIIDGKVYDVSAYLDEHPGGDDVLLRATGKDATEEFEDAGHSKDARELMNEYCIGELYAPNGIPELYKTLSRVEDTSSRVEDLEQFPQNILNISKQYWYVPVAAIGLSVAVGILLRRKN